MHSTYKATIDRIISRYEGGYCWDAGDPGGPTKYGITCYDLAEHRKQRMTSMSAWAPIVKAMMLSEAEEIYVTKYAAGIRYDLLPAGVDGIMIDYGINSGNSRAIRAAQVLLGQKATGVFTDQLLAALLKANPKWFIDSMCAERLHFMHGIRGGTAWAQFGKGWGSRVADLKVYCEHLSSASAGAAPVAIDLSTTPTPKAINVVHPIAIPAITAAPVLVGAGAAAGGQIKNFLITSGVAIVGAVGSFAFHYMQTQNANRRIVLPPGVEPRTY